jgi:hypothetical protein
MTACPYELVIGMDRLDRKADLCLIDTRTGRRWTLTLNTSPDALWEWLHLLVKQVGEAGVGTSRGIVLEPRIFAGSRQLRGQEQRPM